MEPQSTSGFRNGDSFAKSGFMHIASNLSIQFAQQFPQLFSFGPQHVVLLAFLLNISVQLEATPHTFSYRAQKFVDFRPLDKSVSFRFLTLSYLDRSTFSCLSSFSFSSKCSLRWDFAFLIRTLRSTNRFQEPCVAPGPDFVSLPFRTQEPQFKTRYRSSN